MNKGKGYNMGRIMIAGTSSGCGKTTVACAILAILKEQGKNVVSFKCGPENLDTTFQKEILDIPSYNLDSFIMSDNTVKYLIGEHSGDIDIIDGVKGYYDGLNFSTNASTNKMSVITKTPTILVIDCTDAAASVAAVISGFLKYKTNTIEGVIFNRLDAALFDGMKKLCEEIKIKCLGYIPRIKELEDETRSLALVTDLEIGHKKNLIKSFADMAEKTLDIDGIIKVSEGAKSIKYKELPISYIGKAKIAVSYDKAFCHAYTDNMDLLKKMGADIVYFSPLKDEKLPDDIDGIFITGGYPEMYCLELARNVAMKKSIKDAIDAGIPTIAVSGGFMYLHETLQDIKGMNYEMVGVIEGKCVRSVIIDNAGYIEIKSDKDTLILKKGEAMRSYEFRRYESTKPGYDLIFKKNDEEWREAHCGKTFYGGFPNLQLYSNIKMAKNFMKACVK